MTLSQKPGPALAAVVDEDRTVSPRLFTVAVLSIRLRKMTYLACIVRNRLYFYIRLFLLALDEMLKT